MSACTPGRIRWHETLILLGLCAGCHGLNLAAPAPEKFPQEQTLAPPSKYWVRVSQFVFLSDFKLKRDLPLFQELAKLRDQVYAELQLPGTKVPVQVYIFEDRDHYDRFMHSKYPDLPKRRAFFVAQPHRVGGTEDLLVFTYWGERVKEDLRHELTHALLHSVLKDVPLWLDEGLAEYFEVPPSCKGIHLHHLDQIRRGVGCPFTPDLARLEKLSQVQQMSPAEYREAWAWVHLMLRDKPQGKAVLLGYLQQLRVTDKPKPLQPLLASAYPRLNDALEKHLAQLKPATNSTPTAQR